MRRAPQLLQRMTREVVVAWRQVEHTRNLVERLEDVLTRDERMLARFAAAVR